MRDIYYVSSLFAYGLFYLMLDDFHFNLGLFLFTFIQLLLAFYLHTKYIYNEDFCVMDDDFKKIVAHDTILFLGGALQKKMIDEDQYDRMVRVANRNKYRHLRLIVFLSTAIVVAITLKLFNPNMAYLLTTIVLWMTLGLSTLWGHLLIPKFFSLVLICYYTGNAVIKGQHSLFHYIILALFLGLIIFHQIISRKLKMSLLSSHRVIKILKLNGKSFYPVLLMPLFFALCLSFMDQWGKMANKSHPQVKTNKQKTSDQKNQIVTEENNQTRKKDHLESEDSKVPLDFATYEKLQSFQGPMLPSGQQIIGLNLNDSLKKAQSLGQNSKMQEELNNYEQSRRLLIDEMEKMRKEVHSNWNQSQSLPVAKESQLQTLQQRLDQFIKDGENIQRWSDRDSSSDQVSVLDELKEIDQKIQKMLNQHSVQKEIAKLETQQAQERQQGQETQETQQAQERQQGQETQQVQQKQDAESAVTKGEKEKGKEKDFSEDLLKKNDNNKTTSSMNQNPNFSFLKKIPKDLLVKLLIIAGMGLVVYLVQNYFKKKDQLEEEVEQQDKIDPRKILDEYKGMQFENDAQELIYLYNQFYELARSKYYPQTQAPPPEMLYRQCYQSKRVAKDVEAFTSIFKDFMYNQKKLTPKLTQMFKKNILKLIKLGG